MIHSSYSFSDRVSSDALPPLSFLQNRISNGKTILEHQQSQDTDNKTIVGKMFKAPLSHDQHQ
jgi:hypothetical protein